MENKEPNPYEGKDIVFESIASRIMILVVLLIAAIFGIINGNYVITVFAGIIIGVVVYKTSKTVFLAPNGKLHNEYVEWQERQWQSDLGPFIYTEDGFILTAGENEHSFNWTDVDTILGYRPYTHMEELFAMQISMNNGYKFRMTDNTEGWVQFLKHLQSQFQIQDDWNENLSAAISEGTVFPRVLFDRLNREDAIAMTAYDETLDDHDRTKFIDNDGMWVME